MFGIAASLRHPTICFCRSPSKDRRQRISEQRLRRKQLEAAVCSQKALLAAAQKLCRGVKSEEGTLKEEELLQETSLMRLESEFEAKQQRHLAKSNSYWERAPFLSTDTGSFDRYKEELHCERQEVQQLEAKLRAALVCEEKAEHQKRGFALNFKTM